MGYQAVVNFGTVSFYASNIRAVKKPGTLKQVHGKRIVQRQIPHRDVWDWDITIDCVKEGTQDEIDQFKEDFYDLFGDPQSYVDGNANHTGSYLIQSNGLSWDENPDKYDSGYVTFSVKLIQYNQTAPGA